VTPFALLWFLTLPLSAFFAPLLAGSRGTPTKTHIALALLLLLVGGIGDVQRLAEQHALHRWQPVEARVVRSEAGRRPHGWRFEYEYRIGDTTFRGSRYTLAPYFRSRRGTQALLAKYPVGQPLTVFVDSKAPEASVVYGKPHYALPLAGALLHTLLAVGLARGWLRTPEQARASR